MEEQLKIALPKGRLLGETAAMLQKADWGLSEYQEGMRTYRLQSRRFPSLLAKVFHEKDVPIQVAIGNYDLGICGLDWIEELRAKYPSSGLVKIRDLGYGEGALFMVASRSGTVNMKELAASEVVRLASEYPNLAESFALEKRLRRFCVFPLWGAAEVYPAECADLALMSGSRDQRSFNHDLVAVSPVLEFSAYLVANRESWEKKDLSEILASLDGKLRPIVTRPTGSVASEVSAVRPASPSKSDRNLIRLALPDGHQQSHTLQLLNRAGIGITDYPSQSGNRRPGIDLPGVSVKVIRPQDMPSQVANGNFDLAITGRDWLADHLYQFPASPVTELLGLGSGRVRIVAVVSQDLPVSDTGGLRKFCSSRSAPIRVASEYTNIADKYARDNHLGVYRVIPTWGATEAFLPEDADVLIENTETGRTIARHNLKIIDTLFESTACVVGNQDSLDSAKGRRIKSIVKRLRGAVEAV